MNNNKLISCSSWHTSKASPTELRRYQSNPSPKHRQKHLPKKPLIFSLEIHQKQKSAELQRLASNRDQSGVFSLEKVNLERIKEQRQFLEHAKMPSFNIKRIFDKNKDKRREGRQKTKVTPLSQTEMVNTQVKSNKYDLKEFWNKYLQSQQVVPRNSAEFEELNRHMGVIVNRQRANKSEALTRTTFDYNKIQANPQIRRERHMDRHMDKHMERLFDSKDRTTFFVNNFIKTRLRKRNNPGTSNSPRPLEPPEMYIKKTEMPPKRTAYKATQRQETFEKNWVVPWEKVHDTEEDNFIS